MAEVKGDAKRLQGTVYALESAREDGVPAPLKSDASPAK
jgi:hypothetical protein